MGGLTVRGASNMLTGANYIMQSSIRMGYLIAEKAT